MTASDEGEGAGMPGPGLDATTVDGSTVPRADRAEATPDDMDAQILAITYDVAMASLHRVIAPSLVDFLS